METVEIALIVLGALNLLLLITVFFRRGETASIIGELSRQNSTVEKSVLEGLVRIQEKVYQDLKEGREDQKKELVAIRAEVEKKLSETVKQNVESFSSVAEQLGQLYEATGKVVELSKGVHDLQLILSRPHSRGVFGEMTLERMLADLFGEHTELFETQYLVEGRERVDAAIFLKPDRSQFLAVDAKFPLEHATPLIEGEGTPEMERAFAKDVKDRAEEIAKKYIKPPLTLEFAFMFVPSESVYYLLLKNQKLHEVLLQKRVVPTSPNSFYAYLQVLAVAFRGMRIEQKTVEIQRGVIQVAKDFAKFVGNYDKIGEKLGQASKAYDSTRKDVERFTKRIDKMQLGEVNQPAALSESSVSKES